MARLNNEQRRAFLLYVKDLVAEDGSLMLDIMRAMTEGQAQALEHAHKLRVDAEVSVSWLIDMVPKSKLAKHPSMSAKAKLVLMNSGMFGGTTYAERIAEEILSDEEMARLNEKASADREREQRAADDQKLRVNRERARHQKKPVSTILADAVAKDIFREKATLTAYKVDNGRGPWAFHAWVIVVNDMAPSKPKESSMLYVGDGENGRDTYASEALCREAINAIYEIGKSRAKGADEEHE